MVVGARVAGRRRLASRPWGSFVAVSFTRPPNRERSVWVGELKRDKGGGSGVSVSHTKREMYVCMYAGCTGTWLQWLVGTTEPVEERFGCWRKSIETRRRAASAAGTDHATTTGIGRAWA